MGRRKLDDVALQVRILDLIKAGHGRHAACEICGVSPGQYSSYLKVNPEFREAVEDAVQQSIEPVLQAQRARALEGDTTSATLYLKYVAPPPVGESKHQEVRHTHELVDPKTIDSIAELEARVREREVIDVEELPSESSGQHGDSEGVPRLDD